MIETQPVARRRAPAPVLVAAFALIAAVGAGPARAQVTKPWVPAGDSLLRDVTTARMRFMHQQGDSIGGDNFGPYDDVSRIARKLLQSLGREHFVQAPAIEATLDSLGFDTEVTVDPAFPEIVALLVRNPFRVSSDAAGFLYWHVRQDLRMQGIGFPPASGVKLRAWYTGRQNAPYEACLVYTGKGAAQRPGLKFLRMGPDGRYWNLVQYEGKGPEFGERAVLSFADVNLDGQPEILSFNPVDEDSSFVLRSGVPPIVNEFIYTERPEGFVLHDARTVPGPVEALRMFIAHLRSPEPERAKFFMMKPERLKDALANGWGKLRGRGAWTVEYGEQDQAWPEWLAVRTNDPGGAKRWIFHFYIQDGRWVIRDWTPVKEKGPAVTPSSGAPADTARGGSK